MLQIYVRRESEISVCLELWPNLQIKTVYVLVDLFYLFLLKIQFEGNTFID